MSRDFLYIEDQAALAALCRELAAASWLALDTEFERESTYYPELCLLQITDGATVAVIDVPALHDSTPLLDLLYNERIIKVLHSARQDLEIFYHLRGSVPGPVFDTQIAALLLGYPDQAGYATLVSRVLGVELDKLHTRARWKQRPLSEGQLHYAVDDVIYLGRMYLEFSARLSAQGRLDWLDEDFAALRDPRLYEPGPEEIYRRAATRRRLTDPQLSVLQHLAVWREMTARTENRPRNWVLDGKLMLTLAQAMPADAGELAAVTGSEGRRLRRYGAQLLEVITSARTRAPAPVDESKHHDPLSPHQQKILELMQEFVRVTAEREGLDTEVLASRKNLRTLLREPGRSGLLRGWRRRMVGYDLLGFVTGATHLSIDGRDYRVDEA